MNADLVDFLRTGRLGDLFVGMSQDDVMATVGEPDGVAGGGRVPEILRYGRVQMMCENRVVKAIFLGVGTNLGEHTGIPLVGWIRRRR